MRAIGTAAFALISLVAGGLAVLCYVWPATAAIVEALGPEDWAEAGLGPRRITLLLRSVVIAAGAALLAQVLGAGLAAGLCAAARPVRGLIAWVCLVVLLTPPYIYTYAWSLVLLPGGVMIGAAGAVRWPAWLVHEGRAIWCLGTWTAPVAAAVLACGWRASGRPAYTLALPDATPLQALRHGALPPMRPWIAVAMIATGLLAVTEHTVCDLCQAPTWNTEVLGDIQSRSSPGPLLAWPLVTLVGLLLLALWPLRPTLRRMLASLTDWRTAEQSLGSGGSHGRRWGLAAAGLAVLLVLLPWAILVVQLRDLAALGRVWLTFPREWPDGLLCAAGGALVSIWLAVAVDSLLTLPRRAAFWAPRALAYALFTLAAVAAVSPPALVGDAFALAYVPWPLLSDYWPIVSLVAAARFAIIPMLALRIAGRTVDADLTDMAATDGAGWLTTYARLRLPLCLPVLIATGLIVGLLSLTEVAATHLVRPPGVESVALTLFNCIHYGRSDEIVAMSLYVMVFVGGAIAAARYLFTRASRPTPGQRCSATTSGRR